MNEVQHTRDFAQSPASLSNPALAEKTSLIGSDDKEAIRAWLLEFDGKETTQRAYRKEVDRFFRWCQRVGKRLADIDRFDVEAYRLFLANPPADLVGSRQGRRGTAEWKPFAAPLTPKGIRYALTVLNSLYNYLGHAEYVNANPFALVKRKGPRPQKDPGKTIDLQTWQIFLANLAALADGAKGTWREPIIERELFVCSTLYWSACRREELVQMRFSDLFRSWERSGDAIEERWRWNVHGKGDSVELIPLPPAMIEAIKRYRGAIPATPEPEGNYVLQGIRPRKNSADPLCGDQVRDIVVNAVKRVSAAIRQSHPKEAALLARVTPHWLRHARTKHLLDAGVDPRYVQRMLRHASIETTMIYDSTSDRVFYEAITAIL